MAKNSTTFEVGMPAATPTTLTPRKQTLQTILAFAAAYHAEILNDTLLEFILN